MIHSILGLSPALVPSPDLFYPPSSRTFFLLDAVQPPMGLFTLLFSPLPETRPPFGAATASLPALCSPACTQPHLQPSTHPPHTASVSPGLFIRGVEGVHRVGDAVLTPPLFCLCNSHYRLVSPNTAEHSRPCCVGQTCLVPNH